MSDKKKESEYVAIIWNEKEKGLRVSVRAEDALTAKRLLEDEYGEGNAFDLHDPIKAEKPRS